eukprot:31382-Pelagococcus_subviridis.AAC.6
MLNLRDHILSRVPRRPPNEEPSTNRRTAEPRRSDVNPPPWTADSSMRCATTRAPSSSSVRPARDTPDPGWTFDALNPLIARWMTNNRPSERAVDDERRVDLPPSLLSRSRPHPAR